MNEWTRVCSLQEKIILLFLLYPLLEKELRFDVILHQCSQPVTVWNWFLILTLKIWKYRSCPFYSRDKTQPGFSASIPIARIALSSPQVLQTPFSSPLPHVWTLLTHSRGKQRTQAQVISSSKAQHTPKDVLSEDPSGKNKEGLSGPGTLGGPKGLWGLWFGSHDERQTAGTWKQSARS